MSATSCVLADCGRGLCARNHYLLLYKGQKTALWHELYWHCKCQKATNGIIQLALQMHIHILLLACTLFQRSKGNRIIIILLLAWTAYYLRMFDAFNKV